MDPAIFETAKNVGGWVFATVAITVVLTSVIRWLIKLLERQANAIEKLADSVDAITNEVRLGSRRR